MLSHHQSINLLFKKHKKGDKLRKQLWSSTLANGSNPIFFLFFFFLFWWNKSQTWEIHQPTNYSHHFPIWIQKTLLGKIVQEENQLSFTTLLHPWNFQYFQLQMMDPSSLIPSNCPWMTIESAMEAGISTILLSL